MKKILDKITITGADDSIKQEEILELSRQYPFVEWGILVSHSQIGCPRFPSEKWLKGLQILSQNIVMKCSAHVCGRWVRQICEGKWDWLHDIETKIWMSFVRMQLNFHSYMHKIKQEEFIDGIKTRCPPSVREVIFQIDNVNNDILNIARESSINAVPLFDLSGGTGRLPDMWPTAMGCYCGYAGGLSPENVVEQLELIETVCGDRTIWIDVETHVRSEDNQQFDLDKVVQFIEAAKPWVVDSPFNPK